MKCRSRYVRKPSPGGSRLHRSVAEGVTRSDTGRVTVDVEHRKGRAPITLGSQRTRAIDTQLCRVTEMWFPPGAVLPAHRHDRPIFAVMLHGGFETRIGRQSLDCLAGRSWIEPCEELHENRVGADGARVVVLQPDLLAPDLAPFARMLDSVGLHGDPQILRDARRVSLELSDGDDLSASAIDALLLLMCVRAARFPADNEGTNAPPPWLDRVRQYLHDNWRLRVEAGRLEEVAGVPAWRVARAFRRFYRSSVGGYARDLRAQWAIHELETSEHSLAEIAIRAGFADQSHFTRACRAATGLAPQAYRKRARGRLSPPPS